MKFIHTSDWQIGMPFLFLKEDSRKAMHNARLDAINGLLLFHASFLSLESAVDGFCSGTGAGSTGAP